VSDVLVIASVRTEVAGFLGTLIYVYSLIILAYIVMNLIFAFGARPAYSPLLDKVLGFLRDVSEPFLSIFRRFIPPLGPLDLSPIVAILTLNIVGGLIVSIIHG
jgi:YggT family protein